MTSDWHPVAEDDPAPGDPGAVAVVARMLDATAEAASACQIELDRIAADVTTSHWQGSASTSFAAAFEPLPHDLRLMAISYDAVARALTDHARELEAIQGSARRALERARLAQARRDAAEGQIAAARQRIASLQAQVRSHRSSAAAAVPADPTDPASVAEASDAAARAEAAAHVAERQLAATDSERRDTERRRDGAVAEMDRERRVVGDLRLDREDLERRTETRIRDALDDTLKNRSNFERFGDVVTAGVEGLIQWVAELDDKLVAIAAALVSGDAARVIAAIREAMDIIGDIVGTLLLVLTVVAIATGVGAFAVAAVLAVVVATAAVVKLAASTYLAATGKPGLDGKPVTWADVAWDAVAAAVSLVGARSAVAARGSVARQLRLTRVHSPIQVRTMSRNLWRGFVASPTDDAAGIVRRGHRLYADDALRGVARTNMRRVFQRDLLSATADLADAAGSVRQHRAGFREAMLPPAYRVPTAGALWSTTVAPAR